MSKAERNDPSGEFVKVSFPEQHVALVQFDRGPVNAFHEPFWTEYARVLDKVGQDPDVRAVVLASALPKLFSAGIDFKALTDTQDYPGDTARRALQIRTFARGFQACCAAAERCPVPVIAAVHGVAYGLAIDIVVACDVRYAAEDARFGIKEVDAGLAAGMGTLAQLPKIAGNQSLVRELAFSARDFSAEDALRLGLVSRVVKGGREEVVRAALELAGEIARKSPVAVVGTKRVLLHARDHSVEDNLEYVATWNGAMLQSEDLTVAVDAARKRQTAVFEPLGRSTAKL